MAHQVRGRGQDPPAGGDPQRPPIPAQALVLERHTDGSVKSAAVRFLIDKLARDAAAQIKLDTAKAGAADTQLRVESGDGFRVLANQHTAVNTSAYPDWMIAYIQGIAVANALDVLAGHPLCKPEQARALKKKLAILTYMLVSKDSWPDKRINYGWGSMNMPVARWGGLVVMASANSDHPMAKEWLKDASRCFDMLLRTEYSADGVGVSCPHYIGASTTSFYAWIALANSGIAEDRSKSEILHRHARYYMQLMTPSIRAGASAPSSARATAGPAVRPSPASSAPCSAGAPRSSRPSSCRCGRRAARTSPGAWVCRTC